jgi:hypothetical protein
VKLAKDCASTAPSNDERTKKLWLKIGKKWNVECIVYASIRLVVYPMIGIKRKLIKIVNLISERQNNLLFSLYSVTVSC